MLYLREVNKFLALVCILREYSFSRQGVIDFNFLCFRDAIHRVFEIGSVDSELPPSENDEYDDDDDIDEHNERQYRPSRYESDDDLKHI